MRGLCRQLYEFDDGPRSWVMAAGMPTYVGIFGRDILISAWQSAMVSSDMMRGGLTQLARLQGRELFSGWKVRTLSQNHAAYNPYSYHRGSVWPAEHGSFAVGLTRYGLHAQNHKLCRAIFEAADCFEHHRLPEVFSGHTRGLEQPFPAFYPDANSPQAWSASASFCLIQSMLEIHPDAPLKLLMIDPKLPAWLPELTVENLKVGDARVSLRFFRKKDGRSDYRIMEKVGHLHVIRQPSPRVADGRLDRAGQRRADGSIARASWRLNSGQQAG